MVLGDVAGRRQPKVIPRPCFGMIALHSDHTQVSGPLPPKRARLALPTRPAAPQANNTAQRHVSPLPRWRLIVRCAEPASTTVFARVPPKRNVLCICSACLMQSRMCSGWLASACVSACTARRLFVSPCRRCRAAGPFQPAMVGGNPFAKREGGAQKEDLLADAERSDAPWHDEEEASSPPAAQPASSFNRRRRSTSLSPETAQTGSRAAMEPGMAAAELSGLPPPPPLVPAPSASEPPAQVGAEAVPAAGAVPGVPYYPPAPGATGAWGSGPYGGGPYGGDGPYGGRPYGAPSGALPPGAGAPAGGPYGCAPADYYSTQPPHGQPTTAPAWTAGYPAADQPLTYQTFEQQGGGLPPAKMRCGGLGEQWTVSQAGPRLPAGCGTSLPGAKPRCSQDRSRQLEASRHALNPTPPACSPSQLLWPRLRCPCCPALPGGPHHLAAVVSASFLPWQAESASTCGKPRSGRCSWPLSPACR